MLRLVFLKVGRKHTNDYRIVVREMRTSPRSQKYVESVGSYNTKTKRLTLNRERASYWLAQGVQPSGTVHNLFVKEGVVRGPKIAVTPRSKPKDNKTIEQTSNKATEQEAAQALAASSDQREEASKESAEAPKEEEKKTE